MNVMEKKKAEALKRFEPPKYPEHMLIDLPSGAPPVAVHKVKASDLFSKSPEERAKFEREFCHCCGKGGHDED